MSIALTETCGPLAASTEFDGDGYMNGPFRIVDYLQARGQDVEKLDRLNGVLKTVRPESLNEQARRLNRVCERAGGYARQILDRVDELHADLLQTIAELTLSGRVTERGLSNYYVQGWYHTRYTSKFEHMFAAHLRRRLAESGPLDDVDSQDNKFSLMLDHDIDEEEGHEIWALQDVLALGVQDSIDVLDDVFPETKAIVWSQHDRLTRLPFIGFLGYSFYLEMLIAKHSLSLLEALEQVFGTQPSDHRFIYYHYVVDQGHAIDNIELLNTLVTNDREYKEVIDNMHFIHTMYKGMVVRAFAN